MLRFTEVIGTMIALSASNFVYQAATSELWAVAAERSYFQVAALLVLFLGNRFELNWRR